jgi:hypothetical protein
MEPCPVCRTELDEAEKEAHVTGERCNECGSPQCAGSHGHRPFCAKAG